MKSKTMYLEKSNMTKYQNMRMNFGPFTVIQKEIISSMFSIMLQHQSQIIFRRHLDIDTFYREIY